MERLTAESNDLIAALATPLGESALALIRLSGPGAIDRVAVCTDRPERVSIALGNTIELATIVDPEDGQEVDQVLLSVFRAPKSYTGEDSVEISCHGSVPGIQSILELLFRNGFRQARGGEFTLRAFLNGKMDLTKAEAVQEIVSARTKKAHSMALQRLNGSVASQIQEIKTGLVRTMAALSIQLDYPEDEIGEVAIDLHGMNEAVERLRRLAASYSTGRLYREGLVIALAGRTNAGKSSLFNLFLKEERAIVSEIPGTTRDYIEAAASIGGIPIRLYDTAGLRQIDEQIESEGIRRTGQVIERADLILYLVDGTVGISAEDENHLARIENERCVRLWNKIDSRASLPIPAGWVGISAADGRGFPDLEKQLRERAGAADRADEGQVLIDSLRQKDCIERAIAALELTVEGLDGGVPLDAVALDLQSALNALGELTGEVTREDILDAMFSGFCVGK